MNDARSNTTGTDTIDLADVARSLRRGWLYVLAGVAAGGLIALALILFGPRRFDGSASAIIRTVPEGGSSLLSRVSEMGGGGGGGASGGAAALLGGGMSPPIETEIQIISSRAVAGAVVDSLLLQVEPKTLAVPAKTLFRVVKIPAGFRRFNINFQRTATGAYRVDGGGVDTTVPAGGAIRLTVGTLQLQPRLPEQFTVRVWDREDAIKRFSKNLNVSKAGGEVVRVGYRAADSLTAAAVPNVALVDYLARRKIFDRGANARRVDFLTLQIDSVSQLLGGAEQQLRQFQERSGLVDAQVIGKLELERAGDLRKELGVLEVESGALDQLLGQIGAGRMSARQLAAYPSFLKSPGINELLKQLSELETERTKLLERRLESDDEVMALSRSIANVEGQLVPLGRAYSQALRKQRTDLGSQLGEMTAMLSSFPGAAQSNARYLREVLRLNQLSLALQAQLVQARLSAISEGGDVRPLDVATPPKKVAFPEPILTTSLGLGAGLLFGILAALILGAHGRYLDDVHAIQRAAGVPAIRLDSETPLLVAGRISLRTILLIPVEPHAETARVAERLADTALARGEQPRVLDLTKAHAAMPLGGSPGELLTRLEGEHALVIVRLPGLSADATAALLSPVRPVLLVAPSQRVNRRELIGAIETLRRLEVPCAGVVLSDGDTRVITTG